MAAFRFSRRAEADLLSIGDYTIRTWGKAQAAGYLGELQVCCQTLSDNPALARSISKTCAPLRRNQRAQFLGSAKDRFAHGRARNITEIPQRAWNKTQ